MDFLSEDDFKGIIGSSTITSLRGTGDENLNTAESLAISELDPLRNNFDIDAELAKSGTSRNNMLVRILVHITAFYLFNTVEDADIPPRIDENYSTQLKTIEKVATGKLSSTLETLTDDVTLLPKSNYRFGSDDLRDNDIF